MSDVFEMEKDSFSLNERVTEVRDEEEWKTE